MIEGMFVYFIGIVTGVIATVIYLNKSTSTVNNPPEVKKELFDESKYLTPNKKYFTNKSLDDEGGK